METKTEILKALGTMMTMVERDEIAGLICISVNKQNQSMIIGVQPDTSISAFNLCIDSIKAKLIARCIQLEQQGRVSPILRAQGMGAPI